MKGKNSVKTIVMIIGLLSIVSGIYLGIGEGITNEVFYSIFIGLTLFGSAFFNIGELTEKEKCEVE